jgi:hypothetical protein
LPPKLNANQINIVHQEGNEIRLKACSGVPIGSSFILRMSGSDAVHGDFKAELEVGIGGVL